MAPRVSVVIPTYNRARDLERALRSVQAQGFADWEAVVVDNSSTDGTDEMIRGLADPRIGLHKVDNGGVIAVSRNRGIALAQGEFVALLDSDDWWTPDKLAQSIAAFGQGADIVYHDMFLVRGEGQQRLRPSGTTRAVHAPVYEDLLKSGNALINSGAMVRTALLRQIGPLDEDRELIAMEDFDAWLRVSRVTDRFVMLPEPLGYYWAGGGNTTNAQRTLVALAAFEQRYGAEIAARAGYPSWLAYTRGRALFRLGRFGEARAELSRIRLSAVAPALAAKVMYMSAMMLVRK